MPPNDAIETLVLSKRDAVPDTDRIVGFEALRARASTEDDDSLLFDDYEMPLDDYVEPIKPVIYPADLRFCVTVFYDPEVINDDVAFNALHARMEQTYGRREIYMRRLDKASIEYARLSPYPAVEALFLERGYVTDAESRMFDQGGKTHSSYARRHIAALTVNATLLAAFLHEQPIGAMNPALTGDARWRSAWKMMAPIMGQETLHPDEEFGRAMDHLEAHPEQQYNPGAHRYPLIEHEGLLLGSRNFRSARLVHWTCDMSPKGAGKTADKESHYDSLFDSDAREIKQQVRFEAGNAAYLFRPELIRADAARIAVTPAMIVTWYSQALAAIRKIAWLVTAEEDRSLANRAVNEEQAVHGFALGTQRPAKRGKSWEELVAGEFGELEALMGLQMPPIAAGQILTYQISSYHQLLGGLMGATYDSQDDPGDSPYSNPDIFAASLARWIGELKRKRKASLDCWTAESILSVWRRSGEPLLLSQFPEATWLRLVEISEVMEHNRDMPEVEVTYTWTRDRNAPHKCADRDETLALEGPLLCFPTLQAAYWQEKARLVVGRHGFEAR